MLNNKSIGVLVPAYNEEKLIGRVITTMPDFVDKIIVINDGSTDHTKSIVQGFQENIPSYFILINHENNQGVGKSLIDGYLESLKLDLDIIAVMAGDAQMDPNDLINVVKPIIEETADYVKGNRLLGFNTFEIMPKYRFIGNSFLTFLTKFATGYWHIIDPQCGYTAISKNALKSIDISKLIRGYGYTGHILNMLNLANAKVIDVEVKPIYGEEKSKIKLRSYIPTVGYLLLKLYLDRMFYKYLVRDFHPLVFFYFFSFVNIVLISFPLIIRFFYLYSKYGTAPTTTLMIFTFTFMMGFFSFFFGMWLDMEENKRLYGKI